MSKKPTVLVIMDGFGIAPKGSGNAIDAAKTPNLDAIFAANPVSKLSASGLDVGLPDGQMGNSEVGHTNIGAGRVVFQDLPKITKAIQDGDFFENKAYKDAMLAAKNAAELLAQPDIDGGLIGGASLKPDDFVAIINAANQ